VKLLLDVGNSRMKWGIADAAGLRSGAAIDHKGAPALAVADIKIETVESIWIANVTGTGYGDQLAAALEKRYGVEPRFAAVQAEYLGLRAAYAQPQRLGIDRWLCLLAAWIETRGAACVVSAGTALTFDAVDDNGQHLGGVIAPGLIVMQQNVLETTRFLAASPAHLYTDGLGASTEACVRQGALHACAGLVERLAGLYGTGARCFIAGGDAPTLLPHLAGSWQPRRNLVMEGLLAYLRASGVE